MEKHSIKKVFFSYRTASDIKPYLLIDCSCGVGPFEVKKFIFHSLLNDNLESITNHLQQDIEAMAPEVKPNLTVAKAIVLEDTQELILPCEDCEGTGICSSCDDEGCSLCEKEGCKYCGGENVLEKPYKTKWVITCSRDVNNIIAYDTKASAKSASLYLESIMSTNNILKMFNRNQLSKTHAHLNRNGIIQAEIDYLKNISKSRYV